MKLFKSSILSLALICFMPACSNNPDTENDSDDKREMNDRSGDISEQEGSMDQDNKNQNDQTDGGQQSNSGEEQNLSREQQKELALSKKEMNELDSLDAGLSLITTTLSVPQASPVISKYLVLKEALFNGDKVAIKSSAKAIEEALKDMDDELAEEIRDEAHEVAIENEMEEMREEFYELSVHVYQLAKQVNTGVRLYWMHCPTAEYDGHSSSWISSNKTARNPYFDDDKKACGKVREVLY